MVSDIISKKYHKAKRDQIGNGRGDALEGLTRFGT
jgi:hypothetical protein